MSRYLSREDISINDPIYFNTTDDRNNRVSYIGRIMDIGKKYIWVQLKNEEGITPAYISKLSKTPWYELTNIKQEEVDEYIKSVEQFKDGISVDRYQTYTERYNRYNNYGRRYY